MSKTRDIRDWVKLRASRRTSCETPETKFLKNLSKCFSRLPRGWNFQSWKTLRQIFQKFRFRCLAACPATCTRLNSVVNIACFAQIGQFLKRLGFPSNFCDCSLSSPIEPLSNPPCYSQKSPLLLIISTSIFKKNVWVFLFCFLIFPKYFIFFALDFLICELLLRFEIYWWLNMVICCVAEIIVWVVLDIRYFTLSLAAQMCYL